VLAVLSSTEADDSVASTSVLILKAVASITEADDQGTSSALIALAATYSGTEENDTLSATGRPYVLAVLSSTEAGDTISSTGAVQIKATLTSTEGDDSVSSTSFLLTHGVASITEANDTSVGVSDIDIAGQVTAGGQEGDDTLTTTGGPVIKATLSVFEEGDTAQFEGSVAVAAFAIAQEAQKASVSNLITLYELDATALGITPVRRFTPMTKNGAAVSFGGNTYLPLDMEAEGFEWSGVAAPPNPKIRMSNVLGLIGGLVIGSGDLVGATFTRIRTFKRFLDTEPDADGSMHLPLDVYRIERKSSHNKKFIEFELSTPFDHQGRMLPARQCLRDACTHIYRRYVDGAFVYEKATCPYAGSTYYDDKGLLTLDPTKDRCGKRLSDCKKRFGTAPLPTRAFPGMARTRLM
jgi:lambda family phage minor tail protein L